jgi:hypothetical protein
MHVMCHMRRRIHACHVSYEEEDTCMSCVATCVKSQSNQDNDLCEDVTSSNSRNSSNSSNSRLV